MMLDGAVAEEQLPADLTVCAAGREES